MAREVLWRVGVVAAVVGLLAVIEQVAMARSVWLGIGNIVFGACFAAAAVTLHGARGQREAELLGWGTVICWLVDESAQHDLGWWTAFAVGFNPMVVVMGGGMQLSLPAVSRDRVDRWYIVVNMLIAAAFGIAFMVTFPAGTGVGNLTVTDPTFIAVDEVKDAWWALAAVGFIGLLLRRWRRLLPLDREILTPLIVASGAISTILIAGALVPLMGPGLRFMVQLAHSWAPTVLALAVAASALKLRLRRSAAAQLAQVLGGPVDVRSVEDSLRGALRDDDLRVLYWVPTSGVYVDAAGATADAEPRTGRQVVELRMADGEPLALVDVTAGLTVQHQLLDGYIGVGRLALEKARLEADLPPRAAGDRGARSWSAPAARCVVRSSVTCMTARSSTCSRCPGTSTASTAWSPRPTRPGRPSWSRPRGSTSRPRSRSCARSPVASTPPRSPWMGSGARCRR